MLFLKSNLVFTGPIVPMTPMCSVLSDNLCGSYTIYRPYMYVFTACSNRLVCDATGRRRAERTGRHRYIDYPIYLFFMEWFGNHFKITSILTIRSQPNFQ